MSASLVGSEMCIRDSYSSRAHRAAPASCWRTADDFGSAEGRMWGKRSVSYTHLTLPTICSV
eukprot:4622385-Alexandrium_andersonii.AAC.1